MVVFWVFDQVNNIFKLVARFARLAIQALGQDDRQRVGISAHYSRITAWLVPVAPLVRMRLPVSASA